MRTLLDASGHSVGKKSLKKWLVISEMRNKCGAQVNGAASEVLFRVLAACHCFPIGQSRPYAKQYALLKHASYNKPKVDFTIEEVSTAVAAGLVITSHGQKHYGSALALAQFLGFTYPDINVAEVHCYLTPQWNSCCTGMMV